MGACTSACCAAVGGAVGGTHSGFITKTKKYFSVLSQKTKEQWNKY